MYSKGSAHPGTTAPKWLIHQVLHLFQVGRLQLDNLHHVLKFRFCVHDF